MFKAKVFVTLKPGVLDSQGNAVHKSLHSLNYTEVQDVRIGKYIELEVEAANEEAAGERVTEMCEQLLVNPVIEDYSFELIAVEKSRLDSSPSAEGSK